MEDEINLNDPGETGKTWSRPVILTMLCLGSWVCFGLLTLLFLAGVFNAGSISNVTNQYLPAAGYTKAQTMLLSGAAFALHGLAFTGIIYIWNLRKRGFYLLGLSCLVISSYQLVNPAAAIGSTAVYIIVLLLFGLFYPKMH